MKILNKKKHMIPIFSMEKRNQLFKTNTYQVIMEVMSTKSLIKSLRLIVTMHWTLLIIKLNNYCFQKKEQRELLKSCLKLAISCHLKKFLNGSPSILIPLGIIMTKIKKDGLDMKKAFNLSDIFSDH